MSDVIIRTEGLSKVYESGYRTVALQDLDLDIQRGSLTCIMGPSGHGKSTLLHLLGGLDRPTAGKVHVDGEDITAMPPNRVAEFRSTRLGFVFQFLNLLPVLSALENIQTAMMLAGVPRKEQGGRAMELLRLLGLEEKADAKPHQLSGGQRQRVAIARALANDPDLLLMDEPTGNLDSRSEEDLLQHVRRIHEQGKTVIIVTHSDTVASVAQRVVHIRDGRLAAR
jgi:putative ABC transport system ATP-binding protein